MNKIISALILLSIAITSNAAPMPRRTIQPMYNQRYTVQHPPMQPRCYTKWVGFTTRTVCSY